MTIRVSLALTPEFAQPRGRLATCAVECVAFQCARCSRMEQPHAPGRRLAALRSQLAEGGSEAAPAVGLNACRATDASDTQYSVALPEKLTPDGSWTVHRSTRHPEYLSTGYAPPDDHVRTLYDNIETTISRNPEGPYVGERKVSSQGIAGAYEWITYKQFGEARTALGSGLLHYGLAPHVTVGIYSVNCIGWILVAEACNAYSMISVPLYDTLGPDAVRYIANHAELAAIACSANLLSVLLPCLAECPTIQLVVVYNGSPAEAGVQLPRGSKARVVTLEEVQAAGRRHRRSHVPPAPSDTATLCYTSGTTGVPKGAVLTHANLIANSAGMSEFLTINADDRHISYLPLAHIYERVSFVTATHAGAAIGFYRGDVQLLLEDIEELQPTIFLSVPRLYNRIYDKVMGAIQQSSPLTCKLFNMAYESKRAAIRNGDLSGGRFGPVWDRLVFSKVRARLGGKVRLLTTGASPISEEVFDFLRICFGATVIEGYGMTETSCVISMTSHGDYVSGHVGGPVVCCEVKLVDIPEMNYTNADKPRPRGEICVRGPSVFQGYYKDEEQTREVLDEDGWLHTGDVGTWLDGGRLKIIDRKKNIFKLAQGEYIAPEKIENVYVRSPFVAQSFVFGDSLRHQLVAVVVLDPDHVLPWAASRGMSQELDKLCKAKAVKAAVLASMQAEGRAAKLNSFEQVAAVHLTPEPFSVENSLMTPTFKLKRPQAAAAFKDAIAAMYTELGK